MSLLCLLDLVPADVLGDHGEDVNIGFCCLLALLLVDVLEFGEECCAEVLSASTHNEVSLASEECAAPTLWGELVADLLDVGTPTSDKDGTALEFVELFLGCVKDLKDIDFRRELALEGDFLPDRLDQDRHLVRRGNDFDE